MCGNPLGMRGNAWECVGNAWCVRREEREKESDLSAPGLGVGLGASSVCDVRVVRLVRVRVGVGRMDGL